MLSAPFRKSCNCIFLLSDIIAVEMEKREKIYRVMEKRDFVINKIKKGYHATLTKKSTTLFVRLK